MKINWIECNMYWYYHPYIELYSEFKEMITVSKKDNPKLYYEQLLSVRKLTFKGSGLAKSGTLVKTERGIYLIGDVNEEGGICDDCPKIFCDDKVIAYANLINLNSLKNENN